LPHVPFLPVTYEEVAWLKHALATLEGVLADQPHSLPKLPKVRKTATQLQKKLSRMGEHHAYSYKVPITEREIVILHIAVWLFVLAVEQLADCPEKHEAVTRCLALRSQLAPFVGNIAYLGEKLHMIVPFPSAEA
jgi:hypothetical protein